MGTPRGYWIARGTARFLAWSLFGWRVEGLEHIPATGGFVVAANHMSYADPPLIGAAAPRRLRYMAKRQLFRIPLIGPLIISLGAFPIRREGMDRHALRLTTEFLDAGDGVLIFPAGTRTGEGKQPKARPGVSLLAADSQVPVVPTRIDGSARLRDAFLRRRPVRVRFGAPLSPPPPGSGEEYKERLREHTARIMDAIDALADE